MTRW
jgi:urease subunit gamma/beta